MFLITNSRAYRIHKKSIKFKAIKPIQGKPQISFIWKIIFLAIPLDLNYNFFLIYMQCKLKKFMLHLDNSSKDILFLQDKVKKEKKYTWNYQRFVFLVILTIFILSC